MSLEIQISSTFLLTCANKQQTFFTSQVLLGVFFSKSCLKVLGAAYTGVFMVNVHVLREMALVIFLISLRSVFHIIPLGEVVVTLFSPHITTSISTIL